MDEEILKVIFPGTADRKYRKANLDSIVRQEAANGGQNLKDPRAMQEFMDQYHALNNCITYGGWMENRELMWKGTYLDKGQKYTHLGVDVNVESGEKIHTPFKAKIIDVWQDTDLEIGWGKRVILRAASQDSPYFILGHLAGSVLYEKGETAEAGSQIGFVGTWPQNGNVFEHVHIQAVEKYYFESIKDISEIDGYGRIRDASLAVKYPEPLGEMLNILNKTT